MTLESLGQMLKGWSELLIYAAIAVITLIGFMKCVYPVFRNGRLLHRAVLRLEKSVAKGEHTAWRNERFLGAALVGDWQRFLLNANQLDLRGISCDLEEYINEETIIDKPGHGELAELIPSLLTSLGILGTFMGLMEGLSDLDFSNAAGMMESIPALLSGMRFAFATSVAGIACSLAFNMCNRIVVGRAYKALDAFSDAFYDLVMPRPLNSDVQMVCQKRDDEANFKVTAQGIGNHVAGALEMALGRAMHPLALSVDHFVKGASQEQIEGIRKIVEQFMQQMNASLDGQMTTLGHTMRLVNDGQLEAQQNVKHTLEVAEALAAEAQRIQEASREMVLRIKDRDDAADARQEAQATQENTAAQKLEEANISLCAEVQSLTASVVQMRAVLDALNQGLPGSERDAEVKGLEA